LRKDLGLSEPEAAQILAEELQPIQKTQDQYREMLIRLIEEGHYPLNKEMQDELQVVRRELGISDEEAAGIAKPILDAAKEDYQARWFEFEVVTVDTKGQITDRRKGEAEYRREVLGNGVTLDLVAIPGGKFLMGSPDSEEERSDREGPQHEVTVSPFWMGKYPVTQFQWRAVATLPKIKTDLKSEPSKFKGDKRPVEQISWEEAIEFCARISKKTGRDYHLPTEAEWEYACRAGTKTPFYFGKTVTTDLANYRGTDLEDKGKTYPGNYGQGPHGSYRQETTEVGIFPPNAFGLYDMHGNVWEWCLDHWHDIYKGAPTDGSAWVTGGDAAYRMLRGGSWNYNPANCRSADRNWDVPGYWTYITGGIRVVCSSAWT
jgi:formylglycine-generating enzyme required for sulfatase activity